MSKYNSKKVTVDGITFDSKKEARYYEHLKEQKAKGLISNFEMQPSYILQEKFKKNGKSYRAITYTADFIVYHIDGSEEIIDIKGMETEVFKLKKKMFENRYRDLTLTIVH